jgi:hypothetical protein
MRSSISPALPLQRFHLRLRGDCAPLPQAPVRFAGVSVAMLPTHQPSTKRIDGPVGAAVARPDRPVS